MLRNKKFRPAVIVGLGGQVLQAVASESVFEPEAAASREGKVDVDENKDRMEPALASHQIQF